MVYLIMGSAGVNVAVDLDIRDYQDYTLVIVYWLVIHIKISTNGVIAQSKRQILTIPSWIIGLGWGILNWVHCFICICICCWEILGLN